MIKRLLENIWLGIKQLRYNTQYLLVAVLLVVLPGGFVWVGQSFFKVALDNVNTAEGNSVWLLHDSIELIFEDLLEDAKTQAFIQQMVESEDRETLSKISIVEQQDNEFLIVYSTKQDEVGQFAGVTMQEQSVMNLVEKSKIFGITEDGVRIWKAFRGVNYNNTKYFIFSEHSFESIDNRILARQYQAYMFLSVIFLFLIALAYWVLKQTNWQKQYINVKRRLDEQMMFTNTIAHELRAPLTAVRGYVSFLNESANLDRTEKSYAENIDNATKRLIALINDFLEVARIQSGKLKISFKEVDVRSVLKAVHAEFDPIAKEKGLALNLNLPNKPVIAETDFNRLQQVLTNLVSNAIKYTEKGSVNLHLEQTKLKTIIRIKDTGHGISAEDQQKLFGAFTRVGSADKGKTTGTGLGMWITKQLIELLHGSVAVESIEGVGTHVKIVFDV